jgi:DNA-directed RNA polymerase subunit RPC12/RpoP
MKKLKIESVKKELKDGGLTLLSQQFCGTDENIDVEDSLGYRYDTTLTRLRYSKFSPKNKFSSKNKYSIYNCNVYIKNNVKSGTKLLQTDTFKDGEKIRFKCGKCKKEFYQPWKNFYAFNPRHVCQECSFKVARKAKLYDFETVENLVKELGFKIYKEDYKRKNSSLNVYDEDGYIGFSCINTIVLCKSFAKFHIKNPNTLHNINIYCTLNNLFCKVDESQIYNKELQRLRFICNCGECFYTTLDNFFAGKNRCDLCSKRMSRYELEVYKWLKTVGIKFKFQKSYPNCRNKNPLPFDFYIKLYGLIEVDGEGHFEPVKFGGISDEKAIRGFKTTQRNDKIKNEYCIKNNIKLLRISYLDIISGKYKEVLKQELLHFKE